jgi:aspartokinase-like uncharacterized kinase
VEGTTVTGDDGTTEIDTSDETVRVKQIASYAFGNATNLKALYIPTAVLRKISIEENAFAGTSDEFTVFGGDDAKDDVVILKTEVDQKTWEKIQKWLNGEAVESDLPEDADDTGDAECPEVIENSGEAEPVETVEDTDATDILQNAKDIGTTEILQDIEDTDAAEIPRDIEDIDTAGILQDVETLEDTEVPEESDVSGSQETGEYQDVTENPADQDVPAVTGYPEDSLMMDSPEDAAHSEVAGIAEDTEVVE